MAEKLAKHVGAQAVALCVDLIIKGKEIFIACGENRQKKCGNSLLMHDRLNIPDYFGELIINNVKRDGTYEFKEFDLIGNLLTNLSTNIPVLLGGGLQYNNLHLMIGFLVSLSPQILLSCTKVNWKLSFKTIQQAQR